MVSVIVPSLHSKPILGFTSLTKQYQMDIFLFISYLYPLSLCFPGQCLHKEPQWKNEPVEALHVFHTDWGWWVSLPLESCWGMIPSQPLWTEEKIGMTSNCIGVHLFNEYWSKNVFRTVFTSLLWNNFSCLVNSWEGVCVRVRVWQPVLFTTGRHFPRVAFLLCIKQSQLEYNHKSHMLS